MVESSPRPPSSGRPSDAGLHQNLTRLDIAAANAPPEQWQTVQPQQITQQAYMNQQPITVAPQEVQPVPPAMAGPPVTPRRNKRQAWYGGPVNGPVTPQSNNQAAVGAHRPSPEDSGSSDGVPTPSTSQGNEYNPVIVHPNGMAEYSPGTAMTTDEQKVYHQSADHGRADSGYQTYMQAQNQPPQTYALQSGHDAHFGPSFTQQPNNDMGRLEALVAVATSENRAVERS